MNLGSVRRQAPLLVVVVAVGIGLAGCAGGDLAKQRSNLDMLPALEPVAIGPEGGEVELAGAVVTVEPDSGGGTVTFSQTRIEPLGPDVEVDPSLGLLVAAVELDGPPRTLRVRLDDALVAAGLTQVQLASIVSDGQLLWTVGRQDISVETSSAELQVSGRSSMLGYGPPSGRPPADDPCDGPLSQAEAFALRHVMGEDISTTLALRSGSLDVYLSYDQFLWSVEPTTFAPSEATMAELATDPQTRAEVDVLTGFLARRIADMIRSGEIRTDGGEVVLPLAELLEAPDAPFRNLAWSGFTFGGLVLGGVGEGDTTVDSRAASGELRLEFEQVDGATRVWMTVDPITVAVHDTLDFCPGNLGDTDAQMFTVPLAQMEAAGLAHDVIVDETMEIPYRASFRLDEVPWAGRYRIPTSGRLAEQVDVVLREQPGCKRLGPGRECTFEVTAFGRLLGEVNLPISQADLPGSDAVSAHIGVSKKVDHRCVWSRPPEKRGQIYAWYATDDGIDVRVDISAERTAAGTVEVSVQVDAEGTATVPEPDFEVENNCHPRSMTAAGLIVR